MADAHDFWINRRTFVGASIAVGGAVATGPLVVGCEKSEAPPQVGEDTIVTYSIDPKNGELTLRQRVSSRGKVPRYFTLDPTEKWLVVGNQEGANLVVFKVDAKSGELTPQGEPVSITKPMGIVFLK